jgi:hypothetical protein
MCPDINIVYHFGLSPTKVIGDKHPGIQGDQSSISNTWILEPWNPFSQEIGRRFVILKIDGAWGAGEGDHVAYVAHACDKLDEPLKAQSESGMGR